MDWDRVLVDLGDLYVGQVVTQCFKYIGTEGINILSIDSGCKLCTSVDWNPKTHELCFKYTAQPIPKHISEELGRNFFMLNKEITVAYHVLGREPEVVILRFIGTVKQ